MKFLFVLSAIFLFTGCTNSTNMTDSGLTIKTSAFDFETTYHLIKKRIEDNPNLKLMFEADHGKNAAGVGLELRPTSVLIFGNPNVGTKLMQENQTAGIDLPQKIIVYENEAGKTMVAFNDPAYLVQRHGLNKQEIATKITQLLNKLTEVSE